MGHLVSIRDISFSSTFVRQLKKGSVRLPKECQQNAKPLERLLRKLRYVAPGLSDVSDQGLRQLAKAVAFALRPDYLGKTPKPRGRERTLFKRDPSKLRAGYIFPPNYSRKGGVAKQEQDTAVEFGRCLWLAHVYLPEFKEKVDFGDTFGLADAMAHVVDTTFFTPYVYDQKTLDRYRQERDLDDF